MATVVVREDENRDLGFGAVVSQQSEQRLLNRDGSFNVERTGLSFWTSISPYHSLLTMSWPRFLAFISLLYLAANIGFALAYVLCGRDALDSTASGRLDEGFLRAFFFSVQTFATIGYGHVTPAGLAANIVVTIESLFGLLALALATGLLFARFSRPTARVVFSKSAIVAPYRGITAFEFRMTNARRNQIIELETQVLFTRFEETNGHLVRKFYPLPLERKKVAFFPLSWTVVHPIDEASPLFGSTPDDLRRVNAEFLILLTGTDETFSQTVHTRSSYKYDEIVWNAKFSNIYNKPTEANPLSIDVGRLDLIEPVQN